MAHIPQNAANTLGLVINDQLAISFCHSQPVPLVSLSAKDANKVLAYVARDACYKATGESKRKDFHRTQRIFDHQQTTAPLRQLPIGRYNGDVPARHRLESILVGCTLTNDHLAGSGWAGSAVCRFCKVEKESMLHLVKECVHLREIIGRPAEDELGTNFQLLGHVEHPLFIAKRRLQFAHASDIPVANEFDSSCCRRYWTDG